MEPTPIMANHSFLVCTCTAVHLKLLKSFLSASTNASNTQYCTALPGALGPLRQQVGGAGPFVSKLLSLSAAREEGCAAYPAQNCSLHGTGARQVAQHERCSPRDSPPDGGSAMPPLPIEDVVCYGVGSIAESSQARRQLAYALLLAEWLRVCFLIAYLPLYLSTLAFKRNGFCCHSKQAPAFS